MHALSAALIVGTLLVTGVVVAAPPTCARCTDRWSGKVQPRKTARYTALVKAGKRYQVSLAPHDANADLVVTYDGTFPPEEVVCQSAQGAKAVDRCSFKARGDRPVNIFVVGRHRATGYELSVEKAAPGR